MKRRSIVLILIAALLLSALSSVAVLAEDDDHGADAHSESMYNTEDQEYDGDDRSLPEQIADAALTYVPYVLGFICGVVVLVIIIRIVRRRSRPRYTGKH